MKAICLENRKCTTKQMDRKRSQNFKLNCKKPTERNWINIEKNKKKICTNTEIEENKVKVGQGKIAGGNKLHM